MAQLSSDAKSLIQECLRGYDESFGSGSMSCTIYDTAWVSLVVKVVHGKKQWLFPECFHYILAAQSDDGSWKTGNTPQIDGILNTAASLLSLLRHKREPLQIQEVSLEDVTARISKGIASLKLQLVSWSVSATRHVGFEILVPALFKYLRQEDPSISFSFDGKEALKRLSSQKKSKISTASLYGSRMNTGIHSLEAFIGDIDFDRVSHHKVSGSMMASPSSTAAYLMNTSEWDDEAEVYIRRVIESGSGRGSGGVPSAYPSNYFEWTWILSTLLKAGFQFSDLESPQLNTVTQILRRAFDEGGGVIGFASHLGADVDDTAKGIIVLNSLGYSISPQKMIDIFATNDHFRTYPSERDPSFSANCNVLSALVHLPDVTLHSKQVLKAVAFLCNYWWACDGRVKDKWNSSHLYSSHLLVQALVDFIEATEQGRLPSLSDNALESRVYIAIFQACLRTLLEQQDDGSWNSSIEESSYGILILSQARRMRFFDDLREPLSLALTRGIGFLRSHDIYTPDHIWIEKVSYGCLMLTRCYAIAALKVSTGPPGSRVGFRVQDETSRKIRHAISLFQGTPLFINSPQWHIQASMLEGALFHPLLLSYKPNIFPRKGMDEAKYFHIVPFTWTSCNNRSCTFASASFLYDMMVISLLNYEVDEFMESVPGPEFQGNIPGLRALISDLFVEDYSSPYNGLRSLSLPSNGHSSRCRDTNGAACSTEIKGATAGALNRTLDVQGVNYQQVAEPLSSFVAYVLEHQSVVAASDWDRKNLQRELKTYLLAHVTQAEENIRLGNQNNTETYAAVQQSFADWVRTTSSDHTSCPYSFAFVTCLLSSTLAGGKDCFPTVQEKYLAAAFCRHLAIMCRMYNDYGSLSRDQAERNLNSLNFPEFEEPGLNFKNSNAALGVVEARKRALFELAEYERFCLGEALSRLEKESKPQETGMEEPESPSNRRKAILRLFRDVTDLYGQIYVLRDIASSKVVR
ncbi:Copalyl diphosphate synthase [Durotheca rogersii]|uniref:Copalyl diphosphate synthase n=1 Tax=Durotheca rogersii TaxID=419775 RepID=UPI00221F4779|nr:Copalyl diphosphate synthase [Durotheca rogersii]KAI5860764.1 Copalyl diphosphate synthase [Durotheca rogersii]